MNVIMLKVENYKYLRCTSLFISSGYFPQYAGTRQIRENNPTNNKSTVNYLVGAGAGAADICGAAGAAFTSTTSTSNINIEFGATLGLGLLAP